MEETEIEWASDWVKLIISHQLTVQTRLEHQLMSIKIPFEARLSCDVRMYVNSS